MKAKNIEEYVLNKVLENIVESETKKDQRIKYLESILRVERICHDSVCSFCNIYFVIKKCRKDNRTHYHCHECYNLICFDCGNNKYCKECNLAKERRDFVNSF